MQPIDTSLIGNRAILANSISVNDTEILVSSDEGNLFKTPTGNPYYITVRNRTTMERMLVLNTQGDKLFVQRGQDNTISQHFNSGACITVEWNPAQLKAWIMQQGVGNDVAAGYTGIIPPFSIIHVTNGLITKIERGNC